MTEAIEEAGADAFRHLMSRVTASMTREAERSLWLNRAVAVQIAQDPERALAIAKENLEHMEVVRTAPNPWLRRWRTVLSAGVDAIIAVLTSRDPEATELRQNSPFAGVLDYRERERVLEAFRRHWKQAHSAATIQ